MGLTELRSPKRTKQRRRMQEDGMSHDMLHRICAVLVMMY